jgi:Ni,Fe-hydrogenase I small subunit
MPDTATVPYGRKTQREPQLKEVHILWLTAGLGCDGDSVSITAASEPSIEEVVLGAIPGLPKVHLHNPVLAYETGEEFLKPWHQAVRGEIDNFVLVVEGSIPNEHLSGEGYWAAMGTDAETGQPIKANDWITRLAPKALAVVGAGSCATWGGIHAMQGNPTGCMGLRDFLGWDWKSKAGLPIVNVPGCPVQPDNFMETLLYLLRQLAGLAPLIPLDDAGRPTWLFGKLRPRRLLRAGRFRGGLQLAQMFGQDRLLGPGRPMQCTEARLDGRDRRLPQCRRHLHRLHDAGLSRQVSAVHGRAAGSGVVVELDQALRRADPKPAQDHQSHAEQGAEMAPQPARTDHRLPA